LLLVAVAVVHDMVAVVVRAVSKVEPQRSMLQV
jgi:hypothetical protein